MKQPSNRRPDAVAIMQRGDRGNDHVSDVHAVGCTHNRKHYRSNEVMEVTATAPLHCQLVEYFDNGREGPDGEPELVGEVRLHEGVEGFRIMDCVPDDLRHGDPDHWCIDRACCDEPGWHVSRDRTVPHNDADHRGRILICIERCPWLWDGPEGLPCGGELLTQQADGKRHLIKCEICDREYAPGTQKQEFI